MKFKITKRRALVVVAVIFFFLFIFGIPAATAAADDTDGGDAELSQNIEDVLGGLDLSELQQYLDENSESYLFNFGDNAEEIIRYLVNGNIGTDYANYITEILSVVFSDVISLLPAFAEVVAIALLCAIFPARRAI